MSINQRIKRAIKERGYTAAMIAEKMRNERTGGVGISQPSFSSLINGANIPYHRVEEIANIIGVSLTSLIGESNFTALVSKDKKLYQANSLEELKALISEWDTEGE